MQLGEQIRHIRKLKGYTQVQLSIKTGLSIKTISKIESGVNINPTVYIMQTISKALDGVEFNIYTK